MGEAWVRVSEAGTLREGRQSIGNERAVSTSGQRKILKANAYE